MIRKTGIIISTVLGLILAAAAICVSISVVFPEMDNKLIPLISDNWLIIIFKLHAKIINPSTNPLHVVNLYDIFIITLFILINICLYQILKKQNKIWFLSAISLLILGIIILLITQLAGRSAFMASGLIISIILLSKGSQKRITGLTGILANTLLLIGDFTAGSDLKILPVLFGLGYLLEIIWIFMIAIIFIRTEIQNNIQDEQTLPLRE
jgi:hypothetical protein